MINDSYVKLLPWVFTYSSIAWWTSGTGQPRMLDDGDGRVGGRVYWVPVTASLKSRFLGSYVYSRCILLLLVAGLLYAIPTDLFDVFFLQGCYFFLAG
jgi:hypothetical protein